MYADILAIVPPVVVVNKEHWTESWSFTSGVVPDVEVRPSSLCVAHPVAGGGVVDGGHVPPPPVWSVIHSTAV